MRGQAVTLPDGREIGPDDVLGPSRAGTKLVFVGDAARTDDIVGPASGADVLIIEATYASLEADVAREFGHLTASQAAHLALSAGAQNLILNHTSRRYGERKILDEARAIFPNTSVARDLARYQIRRKGALVMAERARSARPGRHPPPTNA